MNHFFTALFEGMTAKQKGGLVALLGGLILGGFGLAAVSDSNVHIGPDGLDFTSQTGIGGGSVIPLPDTDAEIE